jgi:uroporphyrinogen decarboxylase
MVQITKRERFHAYLQRQRLERPLRYAHYTPALLRKMKQHMGGRDPADVFDPDAAASVRLEPGPDEAAPDFSEYYEDVELAEGDRINRDGVLRQRGGLYHFTHIVSPLREARSLEEVERFPIDTARTWPQQDMATRVADLHEQGLFVQGIVGHIYETAWQIRGYEQFLMDLAVRLDWAESILDRLTARRVRMARAAAAAGVDYLRTGDDIANQQAMMFEPELWRRVFKPRWARVYAAAREQNPDVVVWYHSDGNITAVLDDLVEIGVNILNPVQPECMDLQQVQRRYGDRLLFDGTVGTQTTFPFGTPDQMRSVVSERLDLFGTTVMLSPTHVLEPEVPPQNVVAFYEAVDGRNRG